MPPANRRIVVACAGTAALDVIPRLAASHGEVVALTLDAGQGKELEAVRDRALAAGAARAHVLDVRDEFARAFIVPALRAGALHRLGRSAAASLERALAAAKVIEIARIEQAGAVAHGWTGAEGDAFERALHALDPALAIVAAAAQGAPDAATPRTFREPPREPAGADIVFARAVPTSLNGIEMGVPDLVSSLGIIAEAHGVVSVGARDAAAHLVLQTALNTLRRFRADAPLDRFAETVSAEYARVIEGGDWFSPLRTALDAFVASALERATGLVRLRLFQGTIDATAEHLPTRPLAVVSAEGHR